jgi:hypothetical protein
MSEGTSMLFRPRVWPILDSAFAVTAGTKVAIFFVATAIFILYS